MRISKKFNFKDFGIEFFADLDNLTNHKYFSRESFYNLHDYDYYMYSLHLPESIADELDYGNIPGDDNPGDYRKHGTAWQPMEYKEDLSLVGTPNERVIYYDASNKKFMQFNGTDWEEVSKSRMNKINDTKLLRFHGLANSDYERTKNLLNTKYDYYFFLEKNMTTIAANVGGIGKKPMDAENLVKISRFTVYEEKPITAYLYIYN